MRALLAAAGTAGVCLLAISSAAGQGGGPNSVSALQSNDTNLAAKSRSAVLELYSLDTRLTTATSHLSTLQSATTRLESDKRTLRRELRLAHTEARLCQQRLGARLRFIYEQGTTTSLDLVMGAKSFSDALTQLDDYDRVAESNEVVLKEVKDSQRHLGRLVRDLVAHEQALAAAVVTASANVAELRQLTAARNSYIDQLSQQQSLNATKIARLTAAAQAADARSQELAPPAPVSSTADVSSTSAVSSTSDGGSTDSTSDASTDVAASVSAPVALTTSGGRTLTVSATAYDLPGRTATGLPVGWGIAAVDPSVIPLGSHIMVPGYGEAIAADTGSAIVGNTIDLWFPTDAQSFAWGRRTVTITIS